MVQAKLAKNGRERHGRGTRVKTDRGGDLDEASSISQDSRPSARPQRRVAAPAIAQSMPELKWRLTASWPKSLDTLFGAAEMLAKAVAEATDNKFQIQVFAGGEIVPGLQVVDAACRTAPSRCGHTPSYYYFGKDPTFAFGTSVAFGPNQRLNQGWYSSAAARRCSTSSTRSTTHMRSVRQHRLPDGRLVPQGDQDRRRSQGRQDPHRRLPRARVIQKLGVVPQQIAAGDIYPALEKGTIDAAEWVGPYDDEKLGFYKVAPYYYYPRLVGRRLDARSASSISTSGTRCRSITRRSSSTPRLTPTTG